RPRPAPCGAEAAHLEQRTTAIAPSPRSGQIEQEPHAPTAPAPSAARPAPAACTLPSEAGMVSTSPALQTAGQRRETQSRRDEGFAPSSFRCFSNAMTTYEPDIPALCRGPACAPKID